MKRKEERIRTLFQQLKEEDERNAPSFNHDWNTVLSRRENPRRQWAVLRLAAATALILIVAGCLGWRMLSRQSSRRQTPMEIARAGTSASRIAPPSVSLSPAPVKSPPNVPRPHRAVVRSRPPAILISQWRSPTESLLRIPGEHLLRQVPRLDESLVNIKAIISDQQN